MLTQFVDRFMKAKPELEKKFSEQHIYSYQALVEATLSAISHMDEENEERNDEEYCPEMDVSKIREIDDGDYQGTLLYIIPEDSYQPSTYYAASVGYGSCSGCDTLQSISENSYNNEKPSKQDIEDYMRLALHIVQGLKII